MQEQIVFSDFIELLIMIIQGKNPHAFDKYHSIFFKMVTGKDSCSKDSDSDPDPARGTRCGRIRSSTKDRNSEFSFMFSFRRMDFLSLILIYTSDYSTNF